MKHNKREIPVDTFQKTPKASAKIARVLKALRHEEPDRIPLFEFYWTDFVKRWRKEFGLASDANPYYHYDLDVNSATPNAFSKELV